jgi:DNA-binding MarR family transcriptional regulator
MKPPTIRQEVYRVDRSHYSDDLDKIHEIATMIENRTTELRSLVDIARKEGATWEDIGRELGVTRSAAQQRFGA